MALFPSLDLKLVAVASGLIGLALVWFGSYGAFEKVMVGLVGLMFVAVVGAAIRTVPNLGEVVLGLRPIIPDGGVLYLLGIAGGVGGTITLAAYGYWLREKGWSSPRFMRVMRLDNGVAYAVTGLFVVCTLVMGAELLYSANIALSAGDKGLVELSDVLKERYGNGFHVVFLVGFWSASVSSLIGVWSGVSLLFADFVGNLRGLPSGHQDTRTGGRLFRGYLLWLTFPPMLLLLLDQPVGLILAYGVLGALFMPFLAVTLLLLLNREAHGVPAQWRNRWLSNAMLMICAVLFVALAVNELRNVTAPYVPMW